MFCLGVFSFSWHAFPYFIQSEKLGQEAEKDMFLVVSVREQTRKWQSVINRKVIFLQDQVCTDQTGCSDLVLEAVLLLLMACKGSGLLPENIE
jgi:hypothetical protein